MSLDGEENSVAMREETNEEGRKLKKTMYDAEKKNFVLLTVLNYAMKNQV